jgi:hypothetical protein
VSAAPAIAEARVDLVDAFTDRAGARAYLWSIGQYELHEAVDELQFDAKLSGLIKCIGQDAVQQIMAAAFEPFWDRQAEESILPDGVTEADIAAAERWEKQYPPRPTTVNLPEKWDELPLGTLWNQLNNPQRYLTPQSTIEAVIYSVRERGFDALKELANMERLTRCDADAKAQINKRIETLLQKQPQPDPLP